MRGRSFQNYPQGLAPGTAAAAAAVGAPGAAAATPVWGPIKKTKDPKALSPGAES